MSNGSLLGESKVRQYVQFLHLIYNEKGGVCFKAKIVLDKPKPLSNKRFQFEK